MSTPLGLSLKNLANQTGRHTPDDRKILHDAYQSSYFHVCQMLDWHQLRRNVTITFASTDSAGKILPSDLAGIIAVVDTTDGSKYHPIAEHNYKQLDGRRHWYYSSDAVTPLFFQKGVSVDSGSATLTFSPALGSNPTGEYIRLGAHPGIYKMTAAATITPKWKGDKLTDERFQIRPESTRKLCITDADGDFQADAVKVYYWVLPEPLYVDEQAPVVPDAKCIEIHALASFMRDHEKKRGHSESLMQEFDDGQGRGAFWQAASMNPTFKLPMIPRGRDGSKAYFGRSR